MFPKDFLWGAATSAYQIEGSPDAEGKGVSIWDTFTHQPGVIANGDHGDIACDHYRRFREDVAQMKAMGLRAYRFSISWPRVLPEGTGRVNEAGLQFYSDLVDELLAAGITPMVTLFHWDYPEALMARGGWLNRESADWFAEYTRVVVDRLSDRVQWWISSGDDCIALSCITNWDKPCEDIVITNCVLRSCSKAIVVGHVYSIVRNVLMSNCIIRESNRGLCLMAHDECSLVENVRVSNCSFDTQIRAGNWWGNGEPILLMAVPQNKWIPAEQRARHVTDASIRNVRISGVTCTGENAMGVVGTACA